MLVAVYGSLRKGLSNHRLLANANFLGYDAILGFSMYSLSAYPYIRPTQELTPIVIEVYEVTDEEFARLDQLEGYPSFYDRKQVPTAYGDAWIYFIDRDEHRPLVESGNWLTYIQGTRRDYSH